MKDITGVIAGVVVTVAIIAGVIWYQKKDSVPNNQGIINIGITDAAADMEGVTDIDLKVKKVEVHSQTKGWVTVSSQNKTYSLLSLRDSNKTELYATEKVEAGTYDSVRVTVEDPVVKTTARGNVNASLPSNEITITNTVKIISGKHSYVKVDFLADKSLHATTDNKYVFAPVVAVQSQSDTTVTVAADNSITTQGGTVDGTTTTGVDLDGTSRANFELNTDTGLTIDDSVVGNITFMLGGKTYSKSNLNTDSSATTDSTTETKANGDINVDINSNTNSNTNSASTDGSIKIDTGIKLNPLSNESTTGGSTQ